MANDHVILFDGVCNLCNATIQFILQRDRKKKFSFTASQSGPGQAILQQHGIPDAGLATVVYVKKGVPYMKSRAVLEILRELGWGWNLLYGLIIIPGFIRDVIYDLIARNRYSLFGRRESCMVPDPEMVDRFLE